MSSPEADSIQRLLPALTLVETHLDGDLSLESLAAAAGLSPHHFHRLFRRSIGETVRRYVQRIRLERGAFRLLVENRSILEVALDVGFKNHETFVRAFRREFGTTPSDYRGLRRTALGLSHPARPEEGLEAAPTGRLSATRIRPLREMHVAFLRHLGDYEAVPPALWDEIIEWSDRCGREGERWLIGVGHDAPGVTATENLRFDACVRVPEPFTPEGRIGCRTIAAGDYAMTTHVGPFSTLSAAWSVTFRRVMALGGCESPFLPVVEIYQASRIRPEHTLNRTELCVPVTRLGG